MWEEQTNAESIKGTESYKIKKEVDRKKKLAEQKGLDQLLSAVYHECIRNWPAWLADVDKRKFVYPGTKGVVEKIIKDPNLGDIRVTEFSIGDKRYKLTSRRRGSFVKNDIFYILELFLNNVKVFAVSEYEEIKTFVTDYYPFSVDAYANEDWVGDFIKIALHKEEIDKLKEAKPAEDLQRIKQLRKDFNIENFSGEDNAQNQPGQKPLWQRWWAWLIFAFVMLLLLLLRVIASR